METRPAAPSTDEVSDHFDQAAQHALKSVLAEAIGSAIQSGQTPPFAQIAAQLFSNSTGGQKADLIGILQEVAGSGVAAQLLGPLAGQGRLDDASAHSVSPQAVRDLATEAERRDPGIVGRVSELYAEHPALFKTAGAIALSHSAQHKQEQS